MAWLGRKTVAFIADQITGQPIRRLLSVVFVCLIVAGVSSCGTQVHVDLPYTNCGEPPNNVLNRQPQASIRPLPNSPWSCAPPYQTPTYTKPPDDSIAFGSLLEAAGYPGAVNAPWVGAAAGSFCSGRTDKQLLLVQNQEPNFSFLTGPTPHLQYPPQTGTTNLISDSSYPWRAVAAGNLDTSPEDELVAVRKITADNIPDLIVGKVNDCSCSELAQITRQCQTPTIIASAAIGDKVNSDWVGATIGNFDGTGKKIALLKTAHDNLFLVKLNFPGNTLTSVYADDLPKDGTQNSKWKAIASADLDGDGVDELVVARQISDNRSPTIFAYKWNTSANAFRLFATSTFGNDGNSNWASAAGGDFNADGRQAVVLVKDRHSNFAAVDFPAGSSQLRIVGTDDLDSANGQTWTSVAATDWMGGDQGASELIAVRAVHPPDRTNVFIYGNPFHRVQRDTALAVSKSQYGNTTTWGSTDPVPSPASVADIKNWIRATHTNTVFWLLKGPGDYTSLVQFLHDTRDWGVDGQQLRVWMMLVPPGAAAIGTCSQPEATPGLTTWSALDYFQNDFAGSASADDKTVAACRDTSALSQVAGRLAQDFPHLVGIAFDDFSESLDYDKFNHIPFTADMIATIESNMRQQAPWMNFAPVVYYPQFHSSNWADLVLSLDSMVFFFRNDKRGVCIGPTPKCDATVNNATDEIADMSKLLPRGRNMLLGIYYTGLWSEGGPNAGKPPSIDYDYNLTRLALANSRVGSAVVYTLLAPGATCTGSNILGDRFCALQAAFSGH
jgi:hypothetical protein